jgi:outer membrane protein assembly factor BamD (BamD/ComL family)
VSTIPGRTEVELLQTASTVLGSNPSEALQLCEEHQRNYPGGAMTQEREMIAITALVRLGRQEDAYARAERFRRNYPKSAYLRQIDKVSPPR